MTSRSVRPALVLFGMSALHVANANAQLVPFETVVEAYRLTAGSPPTLLCYVAESCTPGPFFGSTSPTTQFTGSGSAFAAIGDVGVSTQLDVANPVSSIGDGLLLSTRATFRDEFSVVGGPIDLTVTMTLTGSTTISGPDLASYVAVLGRQSADGVVVPDDASCYVFAPSESCSITIPIAPGSPSTLSISLSTENNYGPFIQTGPDFQAIQDFSNSLEITAFSAADSSGNPIDPWLVQTSSGQVLGPNGYAPEPGLGALVGTGLLSLATFARRDRRRRLAVGPPVDRIGRAAHCAGRAPAAGRGR